MLFDEGVVPEFCGLNRYPGDYSRKEREGHPIPSAFASSVSTASGCRHHQSQAIRYPDNEVAVPSPPDDENCTGRCAYDWLMAIPARE